MNLSFNFKEDLRSDIQMFLITKETALGIVDQPLALVDG